MKHVLAMGVGLVALAVFAGMIYLVVWLLGPHMAGIVFGLALCVPSALLLTYGIGWGLLVLITKWITKGGRDAD